MTSNHLYSTLPSSEETDKAQTTPSIDASSMCPPEVSHDETHWSPGRRERAGADPSFPAPSERPPGGRRLGEALSRDAAFLLGGALAFVVVAHVETHAADDALRWRARARSPAIEAAVGTAARASEILDAGFVLTAPLHAYLARHRVAHDALALANSLLFLLPVAYVVHVTAWRGGFRLSFRLIGTLLFRTLCGWFT